MIMDGPSSDVESSGPTRVVCHNLPTDVTTEHVQERLGSFGELIAVDRLSPTCAVVEYAFRSSAMNLMRRLPVFIKGTSGVNSPIWVWVENEPNGSKEKMPTAGKGSSEGKLDQVTEAKETSVKQDVTTTTLADRVGPVSSTQAKTIQAENSAARVLADGENDEAANDEAKPRAEEVTIINSLQAIIDQADKALAGFKNEDVAQADPGTGVSSSGTNDSTPGMCATDPKPKPHTITYLVDLSTVIEGEPQAAEPEEACDLSRLSIVERAAVERAANECLQPEAVLQVASASTVAASDDTHGADILDLILDGMRDVSGGMARLAASVQLLQRKHQRLLDNFASFLRHLDGEDDESQ